MLFDEYTALFAEIISQCNHLLSNTDDPTNTSRYTLDIGTILPLAITAVKCRDKEIRRQVIALLGQILAGKVSALTRSLLLISVLGSLVLKEKAFKKYPNQYRNQHDKQSLIYISVPKSDGWQFN